MADLVVLIAAVVFTVVGFSVAWILAGRQVQRSRHELESARTETAAANEEIRTLLQQISDVTARMEGDVGRHTRNLTDINADIEKAKQHQPVLIASLVQKLIVANAQLSEELDVSRHRIAEAQDDLESYVSEARTDSLTGLKNRRSLNEELQQLFAQRQRKETAFSLMMIDVDYFKQFNDTHGHLAGDVVLRSVAANIRDTLREMDLVFRYGGEEFVVICPGIRLPDALIAAERVRQAIEATPVTLKEGPAQVTASLGVAEVVGDESSESLLQRADDALYAAKEAGRNRVFAQTSAGCVTSETVLI